MKRLFVGLASLLFVLSSLALVVPTLAAHSHTTASAGRSHASIFALEHQHGKTAAKALRNSFTFTCSGASAGNQVINVVEVVVNDVDSGQAGNWWAFDFFTRRIQVWNTGPDTYCGVVKYYKATFQAIAGQKSPGSTGTTGGILTGDEVGTFAGGYQASITGQLDVSDPSNWPLRGNVSPNPVDYQCDTSGNCPGYIDWTTKYFNTSDPSFSFTLPAWGWRYIGHDKPGAPDAGKPDGVWVNASTGNSGDILDVD